MRDHLNTRRVFLQKGLTILAVTPTIPAFLNETVMALAAPGDTALTQKPDGKDGKILVVVQLSGGNDGLNTVVPFGDDAYQKARPAIGLKANEVLKINDYLGLHPNLKGFKEIFDSGNASIVQGVGYPNPNRSHFRSMDIWQSGNPEKDVTTSGWLGRYFDCTCNGVDPHVGVSMGETLPLAMRGEKIIPLSFEKPESYKYNGRDFEHYMVLNKADSVRMAAAAQAGGKVAAPGKKKVEVASEHSELDFLHRTAMDAQVSSDDILRMTTRFRPSTQYPGNEFGNGLRTIAAMIAGGLGTRVYYVSLGGFDTHAGQRGRHDQLMAQFSQGVSAFWKDLKTQGNQDRVMILTFSEFGRRVGQNASQGTDHGAAAPTLIIGSKIKQGLIGNHPSLTALDQGDLKFGTDFRSIYASLLQDWMGTPSKPILGGQFPTLPVVKV